LQVQGGSLKLDYKIYDEKTGFEEKISDALRCIDTKYAVFSGDDDFFIPSALSTAVSFLEGNNDYSIVHGRSVAFSSSDDSANEIDKIWEYEQRSIEGEDVVNRLMDQFSFFTGTWYSVHKTDDLKDNWNKLGILQCIATFNELLLCALGITKGKAKKLDKLYMVRQINKLKDDSDLYNTGDSFDWISTPRWHANLSAFTDILSRELSAGTGMDIGKSKEIVKQLVWTYLNRSLIMKYNNKYGSEFFGIKDRPYLLAKRIAGKYNMKRNLRDLSPVFRIISDSRH
jgi:glycosyltransferase domain-containing protein